MATFQKVKNGWQAQVARRVGGKPFRKAKNFKSKREAQIWAREIEAEIDKGVTEQSRDTMAKVFDRYAKEVSAAKRGHRWETIRLERFKRDPAGGKALGDFVISEITTSDLFEWRQSRLSVESPHTGRPLKPASVKREINLLKHVFVVATKEWELIAKNPCEDLKRPKDSKRRNRRVNEDEIERLTEELDMDAELWVTDKQITGAAFLFAIETAMRSGEILGITNRHITGAVVHLPETKNDHARDVPMTQRAISILEKVRGNKTEPEHRPFGISDQSRDTIFRAAVKACGINGLQFRDTRHEAITRLAKRLEILDLARVTGHKNLNELLTYYEASGEELAAQLNASTSKDDTR